MTNLDEIKLILNKHGYEYQSTIGSGSFSSVYLCKSLLYNEEFAVKRVENNKVIRSEFNALTSLEHPYVIKLYKVFEEDSAQYLVMEYCPNGSMLKKGKLDRENSNIMQNKYWKRLRTVIRKISLTET